MSGVSKVGRGRVKVDVLPDLAGERASPDRAKAAASQKGQFETLHCSLSHALAIATLHGRCRFSRGQSTWLSLDLSACSLRHAWCL